MNLNVKSYIFRFKNKIKKTLNYQGFCKGTKHLDRSLHVPQLQLKFS